MKIYTLYYTDAKLYNKQIFVLQNDEMAKKVMKMNLMEKNAERFRNEAKDGHVELRAIAYFDEEDACGYLDSCYKETICNLKDLLDDINRNLEDVEQSNTK